MKMLRGSVDSQNMGDEKTLDVRSIPISQCYE